MLKLAILVLLIVAYLKRDQIKALFQASQESEVTEVAEEAELETEAVEERQPITQPLTPPHQL